MKAAVYKSYGPPEVVQITEVVKPRPKPDEVLVRVRASTVSAGDWRVRSLDVPRGFGLAMRLAFGLFGPRKQILGMELAGEIEAVGEKVERFRVGDKVFAYPGAGTMGCHAEYKTMPEHGNIALKPANLTFEEAAAISFAGVTALTFLQQKARVKSGERVLVIGASGAVGSSAVQLAGQFGAHTTGVTSTGNLDLVRRLGADALIDYTKEDFTRNGRTYDIILDTIGNGSFSRYEASLNPGGRLALIVAGLPQMLETIWRNRVDGKEVLVGDARGSLEDLLFLRGLCETGVFKPLIDNVYPLDAIVEAHARVDSRRKTGSVIIRI